MSDEINRVRKFMGGDDTGLQINILDEGGTVHLTFSKPVMALILTPQQAFGMSISMAERAFKAQYPPPQSPLIPPA